MKEITVTGATVEEALASACEQLGIDTESAQYEVIEQPQPKILGLFGGVDAKVRVFVEEPQKKTPTQAAVDYLTEILKAMGVKNLEVTDEVTDERTILNINGDDDDLGVVIGHRGDTLTALQYLVSLCANNCCDEYFKVSLNVKNFREKREKTLETVASKTAYKAVKLQKNIALESMTPYERSIIHTAVQNIEGVTSWSVGENEKRHVVIGPEGLDEGADGMPVKYAKLNNRRERSGSPRGGYNRNGRGGYNKGGYNRSGRGGYNKGGYNNRGGYNRGGYHDRNGYDRYNNSENRTPATPKTDYESSFTYGKIEYHSENEE